MTGFDATDVAVTGIGVVTPRGGDASAADAPRPDAPGDWFDHRTELGRRGYKYLPPAAQYYLAAANRALAAAGGPTVPAEDRGAAVGTNSAAEALHTAMDETVITAGASDLSPATAPYFSINLFGSRMAMEHRLQGFNLTLTTPRIAGLEALQTGLRSLRLGRASWLLAGATEEALDPRDPGAARSEVGAVALVLERTDLLRARGGTALGHLAVRSCYVPPDASADEARARVARLLADRPAGAAATQAGDMTAVLDGSTVATAVHQVLGPDVRRVPAGSGALEPLLQAVGTVDRHPDRPGAVVTASAQGNVAVCWVLPAHDDRTHEDRTHDERAHDDRTAHDEGTAPDRAARAEPAPAGSAA
ncbi:beta-ketoacyl synthase N-terminal-like domain-containing protein [Streptomyces sp. NPDC059578]|uniref:beta-ketoacyl synthase N-terminal-like domain-containing protein n=1 Tax=Streptomyces sp. NPDC059578 TaxID=3346874 RepID=UPI00368E3155